MSFGRRRRRQVWSAALLVPAAMVAIGTSAQAAHAAPAANRHAIAGTRPEWARGSALRGAAPASTGISARIWLAGRDPAGTARYAQQVSTPGSALYRHYLTPAQYEKRFGSTAAQRDAVSSWAKSAGLTVTGANLHYVSVRSTVAGAEHAFSVRYGAYAENGTEAVAPESDASVPAVVAPDVLTVTGLDTGSERVRAADADPNPPQNRSSTGPCSTYYGQNTATTVPAANGSAPDWRSCGYSPQQLRSAYGATKSGLTGKGVKVAILDAYSDPTIVSDVNEWSASYGFPRLASGQYTENLASSWNSTAGCGGGGWYTEQTIDSEAIHAIAPAANMVYVGAASCSDADFETALLSIVDNHLADMVSNSWAATEDQEAANMAAYDSIFEQAATEGIGMYFSSGDAGYNDPATTEGAGVGSDKVQANYPASSPWVTGVGGTALAVGSTGDYQFETGYGDFRDELDSAGTGWTDPLPGTYPADFYEGSGGGTSYSYAQPWYQARTVPTSLSETLPDGATSSTAMREVPDVAMDADPYTGLDLGQTTEQPDGTYAYSRAEWGGTSLAAPLFVGMQALAQQAQGTPIGFANPEIYRHYALGETNVVKPRSAPVSYATETYINPYTQTTPILTYLVTAGIDGGGTSLLSLRNGYSDVTGVGSVNYTYLESFK